MPIPEQGRMQQNGSTLKIQNNNKSTVKANSSGTYGSCILFFRNKRSYLQTGYQTPAAEMPRCYFETRM